MEFHSGPPNGRVPPETAHEWYSSWLTNITNITNMTKQNLLVKDTLVKYNTLHEKIFGKIYVGRHPPLPTSTSLLMLLNMTALEFLKSNGLEVLEPLMYQFFVMQGMGRVFVFCFLFFAFVFLFYVFMCGVCYLFCVVTTPFFLGTCKSPKVKVENTKTL